MDNYNYEYEDEEFNLRDAFFYVLRHLKQMLIVGLVCMLLLGGYKGYKAYGDAKAHNDLISTSDVDDGSVEDNKINLLKELEIKKEQLNSEMEEDELFKMNPYNTYVAQATYFIDAANSNIQNIYYTNTLLGAYVAKLIDKDNLDSIANKYDINGNLSDYVSADYSNQLLYIYVFNENKELASNILHDITDSISSIQEELNSKISYHTITFVSESTNINIDSETVLEAQNTKITNIKNTLTSIDTLNTKLDSLDTIGFEVVSTSKAFINSFVKFGLIGLVAGVILVCFYYFIAFLLKDSVYSADELKDKTDIRVLGNIASDKKYGKYISWINKVEKRVTSTDYNLIATSIEIFSNSSNVLITGDAANKELIESNLKNLIKDKTLIFAGSLDKDINALKALDKCDNVVLLAKCNETNYKSINDYKERLLDLNKNIVGCVVEE